MTGFGQYTEIPDPAFEQILINEGYDIDIDGQVFTAIIDQITSLDLSNSGISNLSGIEDFIALSYLNISTTLISELSPLVDASLDSLVMINTPLISNANLNGVSSNTVLGGTFFNSMNQFTSINGTIIISECNQSIDLNFDTFSNSWINLKIRVNNEIPTLNISGANIRYLEFENKLDNGIYFGPNVTNLSLQNLPDFLELKLANNYWISNIIGSTNINIINAPFTRILRLSHYDVNSIDLSQFSQLKEVYAQNSNITEFDLSNCNDLQVFVALGSDAETVKICSSEIDSINISNCSNLNCVSIKGILPLASSSFSLESINTPILSCIEVENEDYFEIATNGAVSSWIINLDIQISFNNNCNNFCSSNSCTLGNPGISELAISKKLFKITDLLGRETPFKPNTPLIYIYDDGSVEKKVVLK
jgi:hypothetical protein